MHVILSLEGGLSLSSLHFIARILGIMRLSCVRGGVCKGDVETLVVGTWWVDMASDCIESLGSGGRWEIGVLTYF